MVSPIRPGEWFEIWTNATSGNDDYVMYKITSKTNDTWWEVEIWNQTSQTLNQTSYVNRTVEQGSYPHVYASVDYTVISLGSVSHMKH